MSWVWKVVMGTVLILTLGMAGCGSGSVQQSLVNDYIRAVATGDWPTAYEQAYAGWVPGTYPDLEGYRLAVQSVGLDELFQARVKLGRTVQGTNQAEVPVYVQLPDGRRYEGSFFLDNRMGYWNLVSGFPEVRGVEPNGVTGQGYGQFWHVEVSHYMRPYAENRRLTELGTVYEISSLEGSIYSYVWRANTGLSSASGQFTADAPVQVMEPIRSDQSDVSPTSYSLKELRTALGSAEVTIAWRGYDGQERYEQVTIDPESLREEYIKPIHGW